MNKRDYNVTEAEKQAFKRISQAVHIEIIKAMEKAGIFKRKRKLTSYTMLFEALYLYLVKGLSFYQLASYMDCAHNVKLSVTAWKKQLYKAIPILRSIIEEYMAKQVMPAFAAREQRNIYALDATAFSAQGRKGTATLVHSQVALDHGLCVYDSITDEHMGESAKHFFIEKGALYLADRAYAKAQQVAWVIQNEADLLFRFSPRHLKLYRDPACRRRLNVNDLLDGDSFSFICYFQYSKTVYQVRLIGMKLPENAQTAAQKKYVERPRKTIQLFRKKRSSMRTGCSC